MSCDKTLIGVSLLNAVFAPICHRIVTHIYGTNAISFLLGGRALRLTQKLCSTKPEALIYFMLSIELFLNRSEGASLLHVDMQNNVIRNHLKILIVWKPFKRAFSIYSLVLFWNSQPPVKRDRWSESMWWFMIIWREFNC